MTWIPSLSQIEETRELIGSRIALTPVHHWQSELVSERLGRTTQVFLKLELLQHTGTFKPRASLSNLLQRDRAEWKHGVTAFSAGNHAIGLSYAARIMGCHAKVVMPKTASPVRVARCRHYGAEVVLADTIGACLELVDRIQEEEKRAYVHPFDGQETILGDATVGLELARQVSDLDAVIVPVGGGGLCAGIAAAVKQLVPGARVYGVEPEGAAAMRLSLDSGKPERLERVETIADSLAAPYAAEMGLSLFQEFVDDVVLVGDDALKESMSLMFHDLKLAVEPAAAAAMAAMLGPLRERVAGGRIAVIVCGTNIDLETFTRHLHAAEELVD